MASWLPGFLASTYSISLFIATTRTRTGTGISTVQVQVPYKYGIYQYTGIAILYSLNRYIYTVLSTRTVVTGILQV